MPTSRKEGNDHQREVIVAMYYAIQDSYMLQYGGEYADDVAGNDEEYERRAIQSDRILPHYDGWYYSPEWDAPRRVAVGNLRSILNVGALRDQLNFQREDDLLLIQADAWCGFSDEVAKVEDEILKRAHAHGLLRHVELIFENALRATKEALSSGLAELNEIRGRQRQLLMKRDGWKTPLWAELEAEHHKMNRRLWIETLRLHWLEQWQEWENKRHPKSELKEISRVQRDGYERLIKPQDVYDVNMALYAEFDRYGTPSEIVPRILGIWYAKMVIMCGSPPLTRTIDEWEEIARKKLSRQEEKLKKRDRIRGI